MNRTIPTLHCRVAVLGTILLLGLFVQPVFSQSVFEFSGLAAGAFSTSSNVTGTDTASADRIVSPTLDLQLRYSPSRVTSLQLDVNLGRSVYIENPNFSYNRFGATLEGEFYFVSSPTVAPITIRPELTISKNDSTGSKASTKKNDDALELLDSARLENIADKSLQFSEQLEAFSNKNISQSALVDSLSESLLAISEILTSEDFSESVQQVVVEELRSDVVVVAALTGLPNELRNSLTHFFSNTISLLTKIVAAEDELLPPAVSNVNDLSAASPVQAIEELFPLLLVKEPLVTLIEPESMLREYSAADLTLSEDLSDLTTLSLAPVLRLPVEYQNQMNQKSQEVLSYREISVSPRFELHPSLSLALTAEYGYRDYIFLYDSLLNFSEHHVRIVPLWNPFGSIVIEPELAYSARSYPNKLSYTTRAGRILTMEQTQFDQVQYGIGISLFPINRLSLTVGIAATHSSVLRPYLADILLAQTTSQASDDEFSYQLTKPFFAVLSRIFWDIDASVDLSYSKKTYGNAATLSTRQSVATAREDKETAIALSCSKDFLFEESLLNFVDIITPQFGLQYITTTSTIARYTFDDFSATLSISILF